jgi:signal peptidase I
MFEDFFFPKLDWKFGLRLFFTGAAVWGICYFFFMPCFINGRSMEPTYDSIGFNFCNKMRFKKNPATYGDVVILRYVGKRYYLKRIVALSGDIVEFRNGQLYRNDRKITEDYVKFPCDWNMKPVKVADNKVFVIGDNRSMPIEQHQFGMISEKRIAGAPLW